MYPCLFLCRNATQKDRPLRTPTPYQRTFWSDYRCLEVFLLELKLVQIRTSTVRSRFRHRGASCLSHDTAQTTCAETRRDAGRYPSLPVPRRTSSSSGANSNLGPSGMTPHIHSMPFISRHGNISENFVFMTGAAPPPPTLLSPTVRMVGQKNTNLGSGSFEHSSGISEFAEMRESCQGHESTIGRFLHNSESHNGLPRKSLDERVYVPSMVSLCRDDK